MKKLYKNLIKISDLIVVPCHAAAKSFKDLGFTKIKYVVIEEYIKMLIKFF